MFSLSTVGIVCSMAPIIVCFVAVCFLNERMFLTDAYFMISVFVACCIVLIGAGSNTMQQEVVPEIIESEEVTDTVIVGVGGLAIICLIVQPFLIAFQAIANRMMKKMGETCVSTYV
jgi:drug/metabolite transporter (DMT)-like permease